MSRREGNDRMALACLLRTRLDDQSFPKLRCEQSGKFGGCSLHKPIKVALLFVVQTSYWDWSAVHGQRLIAFGLTVWTSTTTPDPVAIADATGRDTAVTCWATLVTFYSAGPMNSSGMRDHGGGAAHTCRFYIQS